MKFLSSASSPSFSLILARGDYQKYCALGFSEKTRVRNALFASPSIFEEFIHVSTLMLYGKKPIGCGHRIEYNCYLVYICRLVILLITRSETLSLIELKFFRQRRGIYCFL